MPSLTPLSPLLDPASPPDFLIVGTLTRDERDGGDLLGGSVTYCGIAAQRLGYRTAAVTRAAQPIPTPEILSGIQLLLVPDEHTTTFRNIYSGGKRQQYLLRHTAPIHVSDLPPVWLHPKIALIAPLAQDVDKEIASAIDPHALIAIAPQGWMRQWDETGLVRPRAWSEARDILPHAGVLVMSAEDLGNNRQHLDDYIALTPIVVLTRGKQGCTVYSDGNKLCDVAALPAREIDPTGAGDVFTAAFLIRLSETNDPCAAAGFAAAAASLSVQAVGTASIPTRARVEQRLSS